MYKVHPAFVIYCEKKPFYLNSKIEHTNIKCVCRFIPIQYIVLYVSRNGGYLLPNSKQKFLWYLNDNYKLNVSFEFIGALIATLGRSELSNRLCASFHAVHALGFWYLDVQYVRPWTRALWTWAVRCVHGLGHGT